MVPGACQHAGWVEQKETRLHDGLAMRCVCDMCRSRSLSTSRLSGVRRPRTLMAQQRCTSRCVIHKYIEVCDFDDAAEMSFEACASCCGPFIPFTESMDEPLLLLLASPSPPSTLVRECTSGSPWHLSISQQPIQCVRPFGKPLSSHTPWCPDRHRSSTLFPALPKTAVHDDNRGPLECHARLC